VFKGRISEEEGERGEGGGREEESTTQQASFIKVRERNKGRIISDPTAAIDPLVFLNALNTACPFLAFRAPVLFQSLRLVLLD